MDGRSCLVKSSSSQMEAQSSIVVGNPDEHSSVECCDVRQCCSANVCRRQERNWQ
jgi:hypothetical protein